jgi:manganese/zinc/iron transport system substrate-binding protein
MRYGLLLALAFLTGCNSQGQDNSGKIQVVTTTTMITDLVQIIGGDRLAVTGLMGASIDPHDYNATPEDMSKLARAHIIFYNGLHLEGKMAELFAEMGQKRKTVAITHRLDPKTELRAVPEFDGGYDPHVWFDVKLWMKVAETVRDELIAFDPPGASVYQTNTAKYLAELVQLDEYVRKQAATLDPKQRVLITAHDAFGYFGRAYGFEVHGLQGLSPTVEASPNDVKAMAELIVERQVPAIFVESSVNDKSLQAVKRAVQSRYWDVAIGAELFSDAMGNPGTPAGTYVGMVRHNIDAIVKGLGKK